MKILIVEVSAFPVGYLGCYGNDWVATPNIDRLAAEGVVFDQHIADCPCLASAPGLSPVLGHGLLTVAPGVVRSGGRATTRDYPCLASAPGLSWDRPSTRSCWTGRYHFPSPKEDPLPSPPLLTQVLAAHHIAHRLLACARVEEMSEVVLPAAAELNLQEQWLLWLAGPNLSPPWQPDPDILDAYFPEDQELHKPWLDPPSGQVAAITEEDLERLQNTYAAVVTSLDKELGLLCAGLQEKGLLEEMCLFITSSCGLSLGEHGTLGVTCASLHEEMVHLPLLVRFPGAAEGGLRVPALTQPVDLPATLLDLFSLPLPITQGHSLMSLLRGQRETLRPYACAGQRNGNNVAWLLRTPEWSFLLAEDNQDRPPQLFIKPDDRWEVNDLHQHYLELTEQMEQTLQAFVEASRRPPPLEMPELVYPNA